MAVLCCLTSALLSYWAHMGLGLCQTVVQLGAPSFSCLPEPHLVTVSTMGWAKLLPTWDPLALSAPRTLPARVEPRSLILPGAKGCSRPRAAGHSSPFAVL